ncbi:MAG: hypothetical protein U0946_01020 [Patescibacteria group bacterium]|nr:hypothetical protein [Patescibacteria group bacterium]
MHEFDPGDKTIVIGESGREYESIAVEDSERGGETQKIESGDGGYNLPYDGG